MFNKRHVFFVLLINVFFGMGTACGQSIPSDTPMPENAVNFNPLSIAFGSLNANYEHLFGGKHGVMVQGGYVFGANSGGYSAALHYRHHYHTKITHNGLSSPFWGPFVYYEQSDAKVQNTNTSETYTIDIQYLKFGANWGRRWIFGETFNLVLRIGYGFPAIAEFDWGESKPEEAETIESITKIIAGIDGELSIGFAF
ncbi:MAG: DUF3575 domain-containing protein [Chitinivibrionales bacterium]|nr:DUF3575 domain-containing protein [Chitinivibrionales bacterium]